MADPQYAPQRVPPMDPSVNAIYTHSRTRTTSSNTFPNPYANNYPAQAPPPMPASAHHMQVQMHLVQPQMNHQRRSPSVNTFSTVSSGGPPPSYRTSPSNDIRRSTSSRSGGGAPGSPSQGTSYVALLRRQKATVWCDRAQLQDPRLLAQQRAAKMRANLEVVGTNSGLGLSGNTGRTSTGLSAGGKIGAKIRHHGKPAVVNYGADKNYIGVGGVPLRLSATEVEGEDSEDDETGLQQRQLHHRRTGSSSRSSTASGRKTMGYRSSGGLGPSNSLSGGRRWSPGDTPERSGSLVEDKMGELTITNNDDAASGKAKSFGSGSSGERLDNVPDLHAHAPGGSRLAGNSALNSAITREKSVKGADDLKRRGSVDERTMTLTAGRLFIANPD
ncbi:hypothetical protein B0H66DRAFT_129091 [Apodospora peruviana]|uniref:Uncharacterized protein n=1 Tax=Apodospora peruviana TaxID=516989 RepID=A0AAE0IJK7_9PEZI|nr:hypothetical protein B0H66DRAFT_129091 [Apodospora peruviana]